MATYDDDAGVTLQGPTGIGGVSHGGTGADMSATGGTGHVVKQSSAGAAFTTGTIAAADIGSLTSAELRTIISDETGSGSAVFATSPTLVTPVIASIVNTGTLTLPTSTDTLVGRATTDTLTNKSIALGSNTITGTLAQLNTAISDANIARSDAAQTLTGNQTIAGSMIVTGTLSETALGSDNVRLGIASGTPRLLMEDAASATIWQIDNSAGVFRWFIPGSVRFSLDVPGNVIIGGAAIATTATDGFLYLPSCAGTPTGTPTTHTGRVPIVIDTTNVKIYAYIGGAWKATAALT